MNTDAEGKMRKERLEGKSLVQQAQCQNVGRRWGIVTQRIVQFGRFLCRFADLRGLPVL
jgi:hypothetical protein